MLYFVVLCLVGLLGVLSKEDIEVSYKSRMSLYRPYVDKLSGRLSFGDLSGGCSVVSSGGDAGVHLTSSMEGSSGSITAKVPIGMRNWKIDVHLRIKPGASGVGIWIMRDFMPGNIFGGNSSFNGLLVFLALDKNGLSTGYPSVGVATAYGKSPVVHFEKRVKYVQDCVITISMWKGTLSVFYGGRNKTPELVDELQRVEIDDGSYLSLSGQINRSEGDITVKTVSIYKQHSSKKAYRQDDPPRTRVGMTWVVLGIVGCGVAYYAYTQRSMKPRQKGILQQ